MILIEENNNGKENHDQLESSSKNINYTIFRGIGKILHRKNLDERSNTESEENRRARVDGEKSLPAHLAKRGYQRPALGFNSDELATKIPLSTELIIAYLFQNYLDLFKVKALAARATFEHTFDSLDSIAEHFMCADYVSRRAGVCDLGCGAESKLKEMASLIAIRSILFNMYLGADNDSDSLSISKSSKGPK